jgi:hypothetical protein
MVNDGGDLSLFCTTCQNTGRTTGWSRLGIVEFLRAYAGKGGAGPVAAEPSTWAAMDGVIAPIGWDWAGWLPRGLLTMLVSASGEGKSMLALKIAASYIRGDEWPDGSPFDATAGRVLWCECEAAQGLNLQRAKAWGLDLDCLLTPFSEPLEAVNLADDAHRAVIGQIARRDDVRFLVVDSLSGGNTADENTAAMMRQVRWLAELTRDTDRPALLLHHLNKRKDSDPDPRWGITLDRVRGSTTIVQPARVIWGLDRPCGPTSEVRRLCQVKNNLAAFPEAIGMSIATADSSLTFGDAPEVPEMGSACSDACAWLRRLLNPEPLPAAEVLREAEKAKINTRTLYRAKAKLHIASPKVGTVWMWSLPVPVGEGE